MIYFVNYLGTSLEVTINSDDRNIPTFVPSYWTQEMLNTIADLPRHEEPDPTPPPPEPDWDGFLTPFYSPSVDGIYNSIATQVQLSTAKTQEHWANTRIGLVNPIVRNPQWLNDSWEYLKALLITDGNPLSVEAIAAVEALMNQYNLLP